MQQCSRLEICVRHTGIMHFLSFFSHACASLRAELFCSLHPLIRVVALQNRKVIRECLVLSCCQTCTVIFVAVFHQHQVCPHVCEHRPQSLWPSWTVSESMHLCKSFWSRQCTRLNDNRPYQMVFDNLTADYNTAINSHFRCTTLAAQVSQLDLQVHFAERES